MAKQAETTLLVLGIVLAVFAVLNLLGANIWGLIIQGVVSVLTFVLGYNAVRNGNYAGARTFSTVMAWIFGGLLVLQFLLILFLAGVFSIWFLIPWLLSWLIVWGYWRAARLLASA